MYIVLCVSVKDGTEDCGMSSQRSGDVAHSSLPFDDSSVSGAYHGLGSQIGFGKT